jgi:hypothetical protein
MWVCIRPRGGQKCYLLGCKTTATLISCPIHRFNRMYHVQLATVAQAFAAPVCAGAMPDWQIGLCAFAIPGDIQKRSPRFSSDLAHRLP